MIDPKIRDMNRSRDVAGPELKRPYDKEMTLKNSDASSGNGVMEKFNLSDLHDGDHQSPITASGKQSVVESQKMGMDMPDHKPVLHKGGLKDQAHFGGAPGKASGYSKSDKE